ncbi:unnamed protein product [Phytomonas sp. Hart1]|nr:unnamed protein product [Phytomonas sp. Hart1]|eukprot:CCW69312.1 unnamed protein product [Phytomonas sp. isolate Hart1]
MLGLLGVIFWTYGVACWCMCFYVLFSCGEGIHWFTSFKNYLLIIGAISAAAATPFVVIPSTSILVVFTGWSLYAMLVTEHCRRFKLWRTHVIPVNTPLCLMLLWVFYQDYNLAIETK